MRRVPYDDARISFPGEAKHAVMLGEPSCMAWDEICSARGDEFRAGRATWVEDFQIRRLPRVYVSFFTYEPIFAEDGGAAEGVFCRCTKTTERMVGERRLRGRAEPVLEFMAVILLATRAGEGPRVQGLQAGAEVMADAPRRQGFGTRRVAHELKGRGRIILRPGGLAGEVSFPLIPGESILNGQAPARTEGGAADDRSSAAAGQKHRR